MVSTLSALPEELILRVFNDLWMLSDLWSVMLTCKQFHRISLDVDAQKISQLAFLTGSFFPALQPVPHVLLIASARRLSEWARKDKTRRKRLKDVMACGITGLAALASEVVHIGLPDLCEVAVWKSYVLIPLSEILDQECGPMSLNWDEVGTVCATPDLALLAWAIYGELFDHVLCLDWLDAKDKLDSVTRFRFLAFCVPDFHCFGNTGIDPPVWFEDTLDSPLENHQQLNLRNAMSYYLNDAVFAACIQQLTGLDLGDHDGPTHPDRCSAGFLFVKIVMASGRKSLEVLYLADLAKHGLDHNSDTIVAWLKDIWTLVNKTFHSARESGLPTLPYTEDRWLERHIPSMENDIEYTISGYLPYHLKDKRSMSLEELEGALVDQLQP